MSSNQFNMIEINGTEGNDNLLGTSEADVLFGLGGDDLLSGSSGGDSLFGFRGNDTLNGEDGNDSLFGNQNLDLLIGGNGNDVLFGGKEGDVIDDGEGDDQLFGNLGDDVLQAGPGNDQRFGGKENDTVIGGTGNDQVFGDLGNDILWGVDPNGINPGIGEIDTLTGGPEQDVFVLGDQAQFYYIGLGDNDFALVTDFNVVEDQISIDNNQVIFTETTLNQFGFGVAISSQSGDLVAFIQNANISQFPNNSNPTEPVETFTPPPIAPIVSSPIEPPTPTPPTPPTPPVEPPTPPTPPTPPVEPPTPPTPPTPPVEPPTPTPIDPPTPPVEPIDPPTPPVEPIDPPTPPVEPPTPPTPTPIDTPTPPVEPPTPPTPPTPPVEPPTPPTPPTPPVEPPTPPTPPTPPVEPPTPPTPPTPPIPEPNTPPNADNDNYNTAFQSPFTVDASVGVLNNDTDGDGDALSAILANSPVNGSLSLNLNPDGSFSYTPNSGFSGVDSFTYVANDGESNSNIATVTINVEPRPNTPPVASNDNYTTGFQSPITVDASVGVLNGDSDLDGDAISAILVNSPANGNVNLNSNGSFSYTPNSGFSGVDSFTYVANDGESNSNIATVTINVEPTRSLNSYSQRGADDQTIFTTFLLTDVGSDGQIINDQTVDEDSNDSDEDLGFFPEAIQDFITYNNVSLTSSGQSIDFDGETELFEDDSDVTLSFNEEGEPVFTGADVETEIIPFVDLRARLIERDEIIAELEPTDVFDNPIVELDDSFQGEIIAYEFLESGTETVLEELFLFTSEFSAIPDIANLATNSLESIINKNLLGLTFEKQDIDSILLGNLTPIERRSDSLNFVSIEKSEPLLPQTYSQREVNNRNTIFSTFLLTNNGDDGQIIVDKTLDENGNDSNEDLGLFPKIIQDFVSYNGESGIVLDDSFSFTPRINFNSETELEEEGTTLSFNEEGEPIFTGVEVETEWTPVVDLRVRLIEREDIIAELEPTDEESNPIVELDESFQGDIIVYEFLDSETETVLEELFLFTNEFPEPGEFNNVFTDDSLDQSDQINLATNSVESIIEENLLRFTLERSDAIQVLLGEETPSDLRSFSGFSFVNLEG